MSSKNILSTQGNSLKKAKDVPKVYKQKAMKSSSTVLAYNNPSNECTTRLQFGADIQTELTAKLFQKHGNPSYVDGKDIKRHQTSSSDVYSSFKVVAPENFAINQQRILRHLKKSAVLAEEFARRKEKGIERAIESASCAKVTAEISRKTADDTEKELKTGSLLGCTSFCSILRNMQQSADFSEMIARRKEEAVQRAIECASSAKLTAKRLHETADDIEKSMKRFRREGCSNFSRNDTQIVNE